jgi:hypothetical protein
VRDEAEHRIVHGALDEIVHIGPSAAMTGVRVLLDIGAVGLPVSLHGGLSLRR